MSCAVESLCGRLSAAVRSSTMLAKERGRMAEDKRYSIISVADDEDEDVVITAGVVAGAEDVPASEEGGVPVAAASAADAAETVRNDAHDQLEMPSDAPELTPEERRRIARAAAREEELERLRETERQLAAKPEQSRMHKIVLALFALGAVVFAVCYYVFFVA